MIKTKLLILFAEIFFPVLFIHAFDGVSDMMRRQRNGVSVYIKNGSQLLRLLLFAAAILFLAGFCMMSTAWASGNSDLAEGKTRVFDQAGLFSEAEKSSMEEEIAPCGKI